MSELPQHVTIVGLGLMGGSLALALRPHVARLVAVDANPLTCREAVEGGVVDEATTDLAQGVAGAELVILATPVRVIVRLLPQLAQLRPDGCLVLDLGSTKSAICGAMEQLPECFEAVGGHPMCGKEIHGLAAADVELYRGQSFILCRTGRTSERVWQVALAILDVLGAQLLELEPGRHDRYVAVVSHLPYVLSATLLRRAALAAIDDPQVWQVSASGFRDTGRLAGSEPRMMLDILLTNQGPVLDQIRAFREHLDEVARLIEDGDEVALRQWLNDRQYEHGIYRGHKKPGGGEGD